MLVGISFCRMVDAMELTDLRKPSRDENTPLYAQIVEVLVTAIREGQLQAGDRLPTQEELARYFGVSLAPVKQALSELEEQGIFSRRQGLGTFVRDTTPLREERILYTRLPWFTRDIRERGGVAGSEILELRSIIASENPEAMNELQVSPEERLVVIKRVRLADGQPLSLQSAHLVEAHVKGLVERGVGSFESLTDIMRNEYGVEIVASQQRIAAALAGPWQAQHLQIPESTPVLCVQRTAYLKDGSPLEYLVEYRHPSWTFAVWLSRQ